MTAPSHNNQSPCCIFKAHNIEQPMRIENHWQLCLKKLYITSNACSNSRECGRSSIARVSETITRVLLKKARPLTCKTCIRIVYYFYGKRSVVCDHHYRTCNRFPHFITKTLFTKPAVLRNSLIRTVSDLSSVILIKS